MLFFHNRISTKQQTVRLLRDFAFLARQTDLRMAGCTNKHVSIYRTGKYICATQLVPFTKSYDFAHCRIIIKRVLLMQSV